MDWSCEEVKIAKNEADRRYIRKLGIIHSNEEDGAMTNGKLSAKVSEKGAVSVYGLRRFPITFYASEWETLFAHEAQIKKFIKANGKALKDKEESGGGPTGATAL